MQQSLFLEKMVDAIIFWIRRLSSVPGNEQLFLFGSAEQGDIAQPQRGGSHNAFQHHLKLSQHAHNRHSLEEIGIIFDLSREPLVHFREEKSEIKRAGLFIKLSGLQ